MDHFFLAFSLILWAVILALGAMKILKQPMIIWYILAGTVITLLFPHFFQGSEDYNQFSEIGIAFLLFIVGMELNPAMLKKIWIKTIIIGILQVILTTVLGIWVWLLWNFDLMTSIYLGFGFAFSSTIVVLKLLDDKEDMDSIYGRQAVGILVLQDIMVMLFMLTMATISSFEGNADKFQIIWTRHWTVSSNEIYSPNDHQKDRRISRISLPLFDRMVLYCGKYFLSSRVWARNRSFGCGGCAGDFSL